MSRHSIVEDLILFNEFLLERDAKNNDKDKDKKDKDKKPEGKKWSASEVFSLWLITVMFSPFVGPYVAYSWVASAKQISEMLQTLVK